MSTKILFVSSLFIVCSIQVNCQTEKETINWIVEKIRSYGNCNNQLINFVSDDGIVTWTITNFITKQKNVGQWDLKTINGFVEWYAVPVVNHIGFTISPTKTISTHSKSNREEVYLLLNWDAEENLKERFKKACQKLIEYNLTHFKKEAF